MAMLIVLESLSPLERAAFVLTEVFGMAAPEVAEALDRSPAAVRQLVHRARSHVEARQPRQVVDRGAAPRDHRAVHGGCRRWRHHRAAGACSPPTSCWSPTAAGIRQAALRPIHGADKVLRWLAGVLGKPESAADRSSSCGRSTASWRSWRSTREGVDGVIFVTVEDDRITALHGIRNPEKLGAV